MKKQTRSKRMFPAALPAVAALLLCVSACAPSPVGSYQSNVEPGSILIADNTKRSIEYEGPLRNPVILIHGYLGARLQDAQGKEIWGTFGATAPTNTELATLAYPMGIGKPLRELKNDTKADALLDTVTIKIARFQLSMEGYSPLVKILEDAGYPAETKPLPEGKHFYSQFHFYYDWRRDISENVCLLHEFLLQKRKYLQKAYEQQYGIKDYDVRFDLIAHSMGGLLGKYYLMYGGEPLPDDMKTLPPVTRAGERYVDKMFQLGTPNAGYVDTVLEMCSGLQLVPGAPVYPAELVSTFPSLFQMMPQPAMKALRGPDGLPIDIFDIDIWKKYRWGLASDKADTVLKILLPDVKTPSERKTIAIDHLEKCLTRAKQFMRAMTQNDPDPRPHNTMWLLFYGDTVPTNLRAAVNPKTGELFVSRRDSGDGKIAAVSARFDFRDPDAERWISPFLLTSIPWNAVITIRGAHMGITQSPEFVHNARLYLLQIPNERQKKLIPVK